VSLRWRAVLVALAIASLAAALLDITTSSQAGYQLWPQAAVSLGAWLLIAAAAVACIWVVCYGQSQQTHGELLLWSASLITLAFVSLTVMYLPLLDGYALIGRGDHLSHVWFVRDVAVSGRVLVGDAVPMVHVLLAAFSLVADLAPQEVANLAGGGHFLLFVLGSTVLCRALLPRRSRAVGSAVSTLPLSYFYSQVFPMGFAFMLVPLLILVYMRAERTQWLSVADAALLLLLVLWLPLTHPAAALYTALMIGSYLIARGRLSACRRPLGVVGGGGAWLYGRVYVALMVTITIVWVLPREGLWQRSILATYSLGLGGTGAISIGESAASAIGSLQLGAWDVGRVVLFMYGPLAILVLLFVAGFFVAWPKEIGIPDEDATCRLRALFVVGAFVLALWMVDAVAPLTFLSGGRIQLLFVGLAPLLVTLSYEKWMCSGLGVVSPETRRVCTQPLFAKKYVAILCSCFLLAAVGFQRSPLVFHPNMAVPWDEIAAMSHLLSKGALALPVIGPEYMTNPSRFEDLLGSTGDRAPVFWGGDAPKHFGQDEGGVLGVVLPEDSYMVLGEFPRQFHTDIVSRRVPNSAPYLPRDFVSLEGDSSVLTIYSVRDAQLMLVLSR